MGIILGRFRKKKSPLEQLEKIDSDIKKIEAFRLNTELAQRKTVGQFTLISVAIYIIVAVVFYFYFFPATLRDQIFYITPLLLVPFIIWGVKRLLTWYYRRKIYKNEAKLLNLRNEKKKLLDHVMETETYKVAKNILEKFAPEQTKKSPISLDLTPFKQSSTITPRMNISSPIRGISSTNPQFQSAFSRTPAKGLKGVPSTQIFATPANSNSQKNGQQDINLSVRNALTPFPKEILPRDRSVFDKMVEYIVGDGPGNRYALICKNCFSHNGMALPEEFEYFAFRCCYCHHFNPARKLRLPAPKLEMESTNSQTCRDSTSSSEKNSNSDTDSDENVSPNKTVFKYLPMEPDIQKQELPLNTENSPKPDDEFSVKTNDDFSSTVTEIPDKEVAEKSEEEKKTD